MIVAVVTIGSVCGIACCKYIDSIDVDPQTKRLAVTFTVASPAVNTLTVLMLILRLRGLRSHLRLMPMCF